MNYYKIRIEQFKDKGYEEIAVYHTKNEAIECINRIMELKPYHWEMARGRKIILDGNKKI